jgi:hypothetical protein
MPSLIRYIMYHIAYISSCAFIGLLWSEYHFLRTRIIAGIIIATLLAIFTWENDKTMLQIDINRMVDQRILEISKNQQELEEKLEMMASLPLAMPGDEIWEKK